MSDTEVTPSVRQRWLGQRLTEMRRAAGHKSMSSAAKVLGRSAPSISRLENGQVVLPVRDFPPILDGYGVTDTRTRERILAVAAEIQQERRGWWVEHSDHLSPSYVDLLRLEATATTIRVFETDLVHGLLQQEGYARQAAKTTRSWASDEALSQFIEVRMARKEILTGDNPTALHAIFGEAMLCQALGGPEVYADQLAALLHAGAQDNITVQLLPFSSTPHPGLRGPFTILSLPQLDFVHVELMTSDVYVEDETSVAQYNAAYERLAELAHSPEKSAEMLSETIETALAAT